MAFALVGTAGAVTQGAAGAAVTPAYGASENRTAGNLLLCWVAVTGSATLPTTPAGWSILKQQAGTSTTATLYYKIAAGADGAPTIALIAAGVISARLAEFSGNASAPVDQTGGSTGALSPAQLTNTLADALAGELFVWCVAALHTMALVTTYTDAPNNGMVATSVNNGPTSTVNHYHMGYAITTSKAVADSDSLTYTITNITARTNAQGSFKALAAVARVGRPIKALQARNRGASF